MHEGDAQRVARLLVLGAQLRQLGDDAWQKEAQHLRRQPRAARRWPADARDRAEARGAERGGGLRGGGEQQLRERLARQVTEAVAAQELPRVSRNQRQGQHGIDAAEHRVHALLHSARGLPCLHHDQNVHHLPEDHLKLYAVQLQWCAGRREGFCQRLERDQRFLAPARVVGRWSMLLGWEGSAQSLHGSEQIGVRHVWLLARVPHPSSEFSTESSRSVRRRFGTATQ